MNAQRRRQIKRIRTNLIEIQEQIESVRDDEQEAFDSMPEPLQMSERGEMNENSISELDNALSSLEDCLSSLEAAEE